MPNDYYERQSQMDPGGLADGLAMEQEFDAISRAFGKLPKPHRDGGGFEGPTKVGDPEKDDDAVNKRTLDTRVSVLEQRKSTCLVNAVGTGAPHETVVTQLPEIVVKNTRYVLPNPFGINTPVICWAEVSANGKWARSGWVYSSATGSYGTSASYVQGEGIVVQTGNYKVASNSHLTGGGNGLAGEVESAPCRVFVRKLEA